MCDENGGQPGSFGLPLKWDDPSEQIPGCQNLKQASGNEMLRSSSGPNK